jgi:hypothetical protein
MNWIFETYSNVYNTAMMQDGRATKARAEATKPTVAAKLAKLFHRG